MKKFIAGMLTGMLITTSLAAFAASTIRQAYFNDAVRLMVNGSTVNAEVLTVQKEGQSYASSYVGARALAEALGATVEWRNNTIIVTGAGSAASENAVLGTVLNPASIGSQLTYKFSDIWQTGRIEATVTRVVRGIEAWDMIRTASVTNQAPAEGYEYLLARIRFRVAEISNGEKYYLDNYSFTMVSNDKKDYRSIDPVLPTPALDANLLQGESVDGWAAFLVKTTDRYPKITFGRDYNGSGGIWFKAY